MHTNMSRRAPHPTPHPVANAPGRLKEVLTVGLASQAVGSGLSTLYSSKCVTMTRDNASLVRIVAHGGAEADINCAIDGLMESTNILLDKDKSFKVVWDLRESPTPGLASTARLVAWGLGKKGQLNKLTEKMGVIVPDGAVAGVAGKVLEAFSGSVPTMVSKNVSEVERYVM